MRVALKVQHELSVILFIDCRCHCLTTFLFYPAITLYLTIKTMGGIH